MPTEKTLRSLYILNVWAKRHSLNAKRAYEAKIYDRATHASIKKDTLYSVQQKCLRELKDEADRFEHHVINDQDYTCIYFGDWSYHAPRGTFGLSSEQMADKRGLGGVDSGVDSDVDGSDLMDAKDHLEERFQELDVKDVYEQKTEQRGEPTWGCYVDELAE